MLFWLLPYNIAYATDTTAPSNPTDTSPYDLNLNDGTISEPFGGCPAGTSAAYVYSSGSSVRWGECQNTFAISYAIKDNCFTIDFAPWKTSSIAHHTW